MPIEIAFQKRFVSSTILVVVTATDLFLIFFYRLQSSNDSVCQRFPKDVVIGFGKFSVWLKNPSRISVISVSTHNYKWMKARKKVHQISSLCPEFVPPTVFTAMRKRPDDDRIVSHDAPRFMLYYHCVRDASWSVIFSTREVIIDRSARCGWFPNMFRFRSFCFWDYRVGLNSLCFKGEFQRCFDWEGFYMYFTDLSRTTCAALGRTVNTNYKTRNW